jgi:large subunit ribosomal protein L32
MGSHLTFVKFHQTDVLPLPEVRVKGGIAMAVPKRKQSKARTAKRRANFKLELPAQSICPECRSIKLPHRVCLNCGTYRGKKVFAVEN